ncbi:universal stress protein [Gordonia sp. SID5947]|uniref:universal stress protein n=1 Tax=Gordonia sp. SID5947 TaxID=2690315 RepID=UPI001370BDB8|nr:universal stress protein [Gordonia sp. SID5947]MYR07180.1 universal stress protein [Gordonia sp. SID5947]
MSTLDVPIVAAVDGSERSLGALRWAAAAADREKRPLNIVQALEKPTAEIARGAVFKRGVVDALRADAEKSVREATALVEELAPGVTATGHVVDGKPALVLREVSGHAHLLAMGTRGLGGVQGLLLGSVSTNVTAHADCPVVVVGDDSPVTGPVVVGVDGSPVSKSAIVLALQQAALLNTSVVAVHSYPGFTSQMFYGEAEQLLRQLHEEATELIGEQLAGHRDDQPDVEVETVVAAQPAAQCILEAARDAQLVVLGSRGRGGFRGLLLGSTSRAVLHVAPCPVMIVRSHPES